MTASRSTFLTSAEAFVGQVERIPVARLGEPGLGEWDVRALVGHTSRSLVTVDTYLDQPADEVAVESAAEYYAAIAASLTGNDPAVAERGRQAGAALGEDPAAFVGDLAARVAEKLQRYDDSYVLTTIAGGMRFGDYLRTRTFELVVHTLDLATATGVEPGLADEALVDATTLAAEVAVLTGRGQDLVLALTGRAPLPPGFSIV
jgi:uncharacterized protein (TIGR03083 family)